MFSLRELPIGDYSTSEKCEITFIIYIVKHVEFWNELISTLKTYLNETL